MNRKSSSNLSTLLRRSLIYQTKEFFSNSTLHGIRYIVENGRSLCEKFMWFCFSAIALVTALIIIVSLWEKFQTNPTITGLETDFRIENVIFPTVTICPEIAYDEEVAYDISFNKFANYDNQTAEEIVQFLNILTKLNFENIEEALKLSEIFQDTFSLKNINLRALIFQIIISIDKVIFNCKFKDENEDCDKIFHPLLTEKGLCFAFNSRYKSTASADQKNPIIRTLQDKDRDWSLNFKPKQKLNILVTPYGTNAHSEFIFSSATIQSYMTLESTYTIEEAKQLSINQRKCIFNDELKLKLFGKDENYTLNTCIMECEVRKSMKLCNCIPPFYRPIKSYPICNIEKLNCLNKFRFNLTTVEDCQHCALNCDDDIFRIDRFDQQNVEEKVTKEFGINHVKITLLSWPIMRYRREVLFGWTDLFVSFGGIAGLFLGFSMLSGVEILYYFSIRACCMIYKNRDELYTIESDIRRKVKPKINMSLKLKKIDKNKSVLNLKVRKRLNSNLVLKSTSNQFKIKTKNFKKPANFKTTKTQYGFLEWYRDRLRYNKEQFFYLP